MLSFDLTLNMLVWYGTLDIKLMFVPLSPFHTKEIFKVFVLVKFGAYPVRGYAYTCLINEFQLEPLDVRPWPTVSKR
jgi:hypothetical protein